MSADHAEAKRGDGVSFVRHIQQIVSGLPKGWSEERLVDAVELLTSNVDNRSHNRE